MPATALSLAAYASRQQVAIPAHPAESDPRIGPEFAGRACSVGYARRSQEWARQIPLDIYA